MSPPTYETMVFPLQQDKWNAEVTLWSKLKIKVKEMYYSIPYPITNPTPLLHKW